MKRHIPPPIFMAIAAVLMWALDRWWPIAHWIGRPWNWFAVLAATIGLTMAVGALRRFHHAGTTVNPVDPSKATRLVTGGVFHISRNPMYLSLSLLLIGWATWLGSVSPWVIVPLFVLLITRVQIVPEERALELLFGMEYLAYRRSVARWLGRRG